MAPDVAEAGFLDFSTAARALIGGCALLLTGDVDRADRLAQTVLARRLTTPSTPATVLLTALREVVHPRPGFFEPPWLTGTRMELVDRRAAVAAHPLLTALQALPPEPRAAVVLGPYAALSVEETATVLGTDVATVERWVQQASDALAVQRPERLQPGRLAEELRTAAASAVVSGSPATDLAHGRRLATGRRVRRAAGALAGVLVLLLGLGTVLDRSAEVPQAVVPTSAATVTPSGPARVTAACDVRNPSCQATVMRAWRSTMSEVVVSHLDPDKAYFTGYSFAYDERYESRTFWAGGDGALGLEVFRLDGGATKIYVQVASGYDTAVRCGVTTRHSCEGQRFLDGNRFTLSTTTQVEKGIEVQHRPDGDQVVTVVARNTTRGQVLDVTRADLIDLVQDPRLRLPVL